MKNTRVFSLLIVDDDQLVHQALKMSLPNHWKVFSASKLEAIQYERFYHAAFVDMHLEPGAKAVGPQIIEKLVKHNNQLEVVAMSGDLSRALMESCLKAGAQRFLAKPLMPEEILLILEKIEALWDLRSVDPASNRGTIRWVGNSSASQKIKKRIADLRGETNPVLIEGETGCGKEVAARLLHEQEGDRPFIAVNLASIPENLFESEMFGHIKGAFTGADQNKVGLTEAAHGGDLFLDEIEALPLSQQAKLLRFLETGEVRRVGAKESTQVKTRVIVASNKPLDKMVAAGEFREDLLYRLASQRIELTPLRDRLEDIDELAKHFLAAERPRRNKSIADDGLEALKKYNWPGNVRELKRVCEQLSLTSPLPFIREEDVNSWLKPAATPAGAPSYTMIDFNKGLNTLVEDFEAHVIRTCLKETADIEQAAKVLQISRSNLYKKIKDYKLDEDVP
ncbi:sigma-54-dependent transcriptional regulator [Bdellovibrio reynosensis]|uniref:Sigma-54 dependent transcriptional regulator n=1 Tax=Bdellovibrio reynosensis TaxID=2835041 RepID=A0ABY4C8S5_9BACT|nr:sigma-54 dependent transcriptional regulator [Bdellovibrio reynosensis]UOF01278.1 sigma-54 dependent transcriptional regulator [Bdellovibrio reynosensis]